MYRWNIGCGIGLMIIGAGLGVQAALAWYVGHAWSDGALLAWMTFMYGNTLFELGRLQKKHSAP